MGVGLARLQLPDSHRIAVVAQGMAVLDPSCLASSKAWLGGADQHHLGYLGASLLLQVEQKHTGWGPLKTPGDQGAGTCVGGGPSPGKSRSSQEPRLCPDTRFTRSEQVPRRPEPCPCSRAAESQPQGFPTFPGGGSTEGKACQSRTGLSAPGPAAVFHVNEVFGKRGPRHVLADRNVDWIRSSRRGELRKKSISNSLQNAAGLPRTCHNTRVALPRKIHHPRWP